MLRSPDQASYQRRPGSHLAGAGVHGSPQAQSARRNNTWARRCSGPVRAKVGGAAGHRSAHAAADGFAASAIADGNRGRLCQIRARRQGTQAEMDKAAIQKPSRALSLLALCAHCRRRGAHSAHVAPPFAEGRAGQQACQTSTVAPSDKQSCAQLASRPASPAASPCLGLWGCCQMSAHTHRHRQACALCALCRVEFAMHCSGRYATLADLCQSAAARVLWVAARSQAQASPQNNARPVPL
ncbi:hypothetical protein IWW45_002157 [Coemansia sp. RSA 485]|nr:hypothetical protein IWW45_002157 [Coemansia sp. RSA 485]